MLTIVQAAQLRKTSFVPPAEASGLQQADYDPDKQQYCTVYAGTYVQQVCAPAANTKI